MPSPKFHTGDAVLYRGAVFVVTNRYYRRSDRTIRYDIREQGHTFTLTNREPVRHEKVNESELIAA